MSHYYEKNITDIKQEYTQFLVNILTPLLFDGLKSIYSDAIKIEGKIVKSDTIRNPGVLKIFQGLLKTIPKFNSNEIENETIRIKNNSMCADIFDDLIKAIMKSNIVLLTYNSSIIFCLNFFKNIMIIIMLIYL